MRLINLFFAKKIRTFTGNFGRFFTSFSFQQKHTIKIMTYEKWPWQYSFPPFFTIQPNDETRKKQFQAWRNLILDYCRTTRTNIIDLSEVHDSPLFNNAVIDRNLSKEDVLKILEYLAEFDNAEPTDKLKTRWYVYWHTIQEWCDKISEYVKNSGCSNSVMTGYEIANAQEDFKGLHEDVLMKILRDMEKKGKAEIIHVGDDWGVKFF